MNAWLILVLLVGSDETYRDARRWFERGVAAMDAGRIEDAIAAFEQSLALRESGPALFNLGMACRKLERHDCTLASLERFLTLIPPDADAIALAEEALAEARAYLPPPPSTAPSPPPSTVPPPPPPSLTTALPVAGSEPEKTSGQTWLWIGIGAGVVAIAAGVAVAIVAARAEEPNQLNAGTYGVVLEALKGR